MKAVLRIVMLAAVALSACRRPAPEDPWAWENNPGLDPHPAGQTLQGQAGPALPEVSFRLDPARGTKETVSAVQPATEEEALYLRAARSGQAWAQTKIGIKYVKDREDLARLGEGLRWLNTAADQNDTEALRVLSALAAQGHGMDQSDKESFVYMRRAAELGSPEAQYELANMLVNGRGMPRDVEAALVWGRKAAEQGHAPAQFFVGRILIESVEQERKKEGIDFLRRSIAGGSSVAAFFLAAVEARGDFGVTKDEYAAEAILKPFAERGDAECQFALASLYKFGASFADRREESNVWLKRASEQGHQQALEILRKEE